MAFGFAGFRIGGIRRSWPSVLAVVIGVLVALFATMQLRNYTMTNVEKVSVPVPARDIPPYTVIEPGDLTSRAVVKGGEEPGAARSPSEVVGKLALSTLYRNEQIKKERLVDADLVKDKQIISVNIDVARGVGGLLRVGDLVDVWWIPDENSMQAPGVGWIKVAGDAVVIDIRDSTGRSVLAQRGGIVQQAVGESMGVPASPPAVAVLAVKNEDISRLVGGASPKSQNIVLSKKFIPSGSDSGAQPQGAEQGGEISAAAGTEKAREPR